MLINDGQRSTQCAVDSALIKSGPLCGTCEFQLSSCEEPDVRTQWLRAVAGYNYCYVAAANRVAHCRAVTGLHSTCNDASRASRLTAGKLFGVPCPMCRFLHPGDHQRVEETLKEARIVRVEKQLTAVSCALARPCCIHCAQFESQHEGHTVTQITSLFLGPPIPPTVIHFKH